MFFSLFLYKKKGSNKMTTQQEQLTASKLFDEHEHLIEQTIQRRWNERQLQEGHGIGRDDLEQYGRIGLHYAADTFDDSKGAKFPTWAINNIMWAIDRELKRDTLGCDQKYLLETVPRTSLDSKVTESEGSMTMYDLVEVEEKGYKSIDMEEMLAEMKSTIGEQAFDIVMLRINEEMTHTNIGKIHNLSRTSIRNILNANKDDIKKIIKKYLQ